MRTRVTHSGPSLRLAPVLLALVAIASCDHRNDDIRVYSAPKDQMTSKPVMQQRSMPSASAPTMTSAASGDLHWTLPDGWSEEPGDSPMRFSTILNTSLEPPVEITVTKLGAQAGSLLANVNRWRKQLDLPPTDDAGLTASTSQLEGGALRAILVDIPAPATGAAGPQRMLAAVFNQSDATWFFKLSDAQTRVDAAEADFLTLCRSIHADAPAQMAAAAPAPLPSSTMPNMVGGPPELTQPQAAGGLRYTVPGGWHEDPAPRAARIATMVVDGDPSTELAITRFPGDVGGELANVNRWRGQLGMTPIVSLDAQEGEDVTISNHPARVYRLVSPMGGDQAQAMLVALLPLHGQTWFFKLTGPAGSVDQQHDRFNAFLTSVSFQP
ncbi:MAG: hypothetical protein KDA20_03770 [Phycisphaerales bacterium]|nr:hypothetical protein [Phycisphaerales bacterium]